MVNRVERMEKITKQDVMDFANKHLKDNNYAIIYKRQGQDNNVKKIAKPAITPIYTNRDTTSLFLRNIKNSAVTPIEPRFVDFEKEMSKEMAGNLPLLYKKNETNDLFQLQYIFDFGVNEDNKLDIAKNYIDYLGTGDMSATEIKQAFYNLACEYNIRASQDRTYITLSGLSDNMEKAMELLEKVVTDAKADKEAYDNMVADILKRRANNKSNQSANFSMLVQYGLYGANNPAKNILSEKELKNMSTQTLLQSISTLPQYEHTVLYYGPKSIDEVKSSVEKIHKTPGTLKSKEKNNSFKYQLSKENIVYIAPYDANQIYMTALSNEGETFDVEKSPIITMYNEYFDGGMNGIVFQEMREARGLAYSSSASLNEPRRLEDPLYYRTFIATQNDKMIDALSAFDEIINNMPISQQAFDVTKKALIERLRSERITRSSVLSYYISQKDLGLSYDKRRQLYDAIQTITLDDVVEFQKSNITDRKSTTCILGRESDLDLKSLEKWGKIIRLTTEDIFGY
jgi:predicted Zn-dependent peptidase